MLQNYSNPSRKGEAFLSLQDHIVSSPETMNVIYKISETQAVWMHKPFPKPDHPEHINSFLANDMEQNLIAAEQLEYSVNPSYTPKPRRPISNRELSQYREKTLEIAASRGLFDTVAVFLKSPEFSVLTPQEK
jgi:hypothetical protein